MNCPQCVVHPLRTVECGDVEIDVCRECEGVWLDGGELRPIASHRDREPLTIWPAEEIDLDELFAFDWAAPLAEEDAVAPAFPFADERRCPLCETTLAASWRFGVQVDVCSSCRGIWLERRELEAISERYQRYADTPPLEGALALEGVDMKRRLHWHDLLE